MKKPLTVMFSTGPDGPRTNPYVPLLKAAVSPDVLAVSFDWRRFLLVRYDVLHVHWLEEILRGRNKLNQTLKPLAFALGLGLAVVFRRGIVSTVHNLQPHEPVSPLQKVVYGLYDSSRPRRIYLTHTEGDGFEDGRDVVIPHGHYRPLVGENAVSTLPTVDFLTFGRIKPYKGIAGLLEACGNSSASFRIVGSCDDPRTQSDLIQATSKHSNLTVRLDYLPEDQLLAEIERSRVVLLPYGEMYNSGAVLLALSVGKPVIVPDTEVNRQIREEVGHQWMYLYGGPFTAASLPDKSWVIAADRGHAPDLSKRDWGLVGGQHVSFYRNVVEGVSWCA